MRFILLFLFFFYRIFSVYCCMNFMLNKWISPHSVCRWLQSSLPLIIVILTAQLVILCTLLSTVGDQVCLVAASGAVYRMISHWLQCLLFSRNDSKLSCLPVSFSPVRLPLFRDRISNCTNLFQPKPNRNRQGYSHLLANSSVTCAGQNSAHKHL